MPSDPVRGQPWIHMGGDVITPAAASVQVVTLPTTATIVEIRPNGNDVYYEINGRGTAASANSGGFVANGGAAIQGPLAELSRLDVYMAAGTVHLQFYREAP